jgi:multiple sugar transport system substrate-binding protein
VPTKFTQKQVIIIGGGFFLVVLIGVIVFLNLRPTNTATQAKLVIWGTDDPKGMAGMIQAYQSAHQGAQISYKQIDSASYQNELLSGLAAGTGPDVFEIGDHDLSQWENVLAPMPVVNTEKFSPTVLANDFPTVVSQDFIDGAGNIYALPLSLDTLAMIYNKDLVDSAGIAVLPKTWDEFDADVTRLRTVNAQGQVTQAGAALGGSAASIPNATDILYLLMLQNGTQMTTQSFSNATFANSVNNGANPGLAAFNFYLQFANAGSPYYTWNEALGDAEGNFIQGKAAIIFDYAATLNDIRQKAPFLNYGVAPVPQPAGATVLVNYPHYQGLAVARYGQVALAWNFVIGMTTNPAQVGLYNKDTGTPPALRSVSQGNTNDPVMSVFGSQALTARSWHEADSGKIDNIFNGAIVSVLNGAADSTKALQTAQAGVNAIINSR